MLTVLFLGWHCCRVGAVARLLLLLGWHCCQVGAVAMLSLLPGWRLQLLPGCHCAVAGLSLLPGCHCCLVVTVAWLLLLLSCCCCRVVAVARHFIFHQFGVQTDSIFWHICHISNYEIIKIDQFHQMQ
jgi:hypothetical protein